ncbi:hypothetical protein PHAVU_002G223900 [Phaseolus vulgaris]|uniref:Protein POLLEN DEFECTIVE IN GUIDANCE 1 n=1 Tax=Phaseolus vulgaris TaxID=3885 RepID=V7CMA9_PHAVU|nr:hypothetical protein PHAVU_002G223900g [Phaseolus vulgaris]ESW31264.1 hypothetical protein PHAVU_002G223900g [Phaseolus vulgaris]
MRHGTAAPQPQPSPSNSLPHRKKKRNRKAAATSTSTSVSSETSFANGPDQLKNHIHDAVIECEQKPKGEQSKGAFPLEELRQRSVKGGESLGNSVVTAVDAGDVKEVSSVAEATSGTAESSELKRVLEDDSISKKSPVLYFFEKVYYGNSVWSTTTIGDEKGRERVYDTIFRLPWRCELLIDVGFFVCFNSFLSLLTVMPTRMLMAIWRLLKTRKFNRPSTIEFSDFGCFLILVCGVTVLQQIEKLARCPPETQSMRFWIWRFISDQVLAVVTSIVHSFILLVQAITLSACIVSHYNALPALLVSNNFAEIKSYVFKGYSKDNVHSMVYSDSVERFHISACILFVLAQNILEAEGPWFISFISNILLVYLFEMAIDVIKHSFIAKFNNISPIAYSEFLEVLCKQTLHVQTEDAKKKLTFVPLAPACVVIRVLAPVYAAKLPYNSLSRRLSWILLFSAITYIMLTSLKVLIGMVLQKHARWYVNRCQRRKHHLHAD